MEPKPDDLRGLALFARLREGEIERLLPYMRGESREAGEEILREGEEGESLYVILSGGAEVRKRIGEGREKLLANLEPGTFFGELALFGRGGRTATVRATERTDLLRIGKTEFQKLLEEEPSLTSRLLFTMLETLAARLRESDEMIRDFILWTIHGTAGGG